MAIVNRSMPEGVITFDDLQDLYGGVNPISLSEYYRGGGLVPNSLTGSNYYTPLAGSYVPNVPTGGAISLNNFRNASNSYTYNYSTSPYKTGAATSVSVAVPITAFLPSFKRNTGDTFRVCASNIGGGTKWIQLPYLHATFTVGTSASVRAPKLHSKQYIIQLVYNGATTVTINGFYEGSSTGDPQGAVHLQGVVSTS